MEQQSDAVNGADSEAVRLPRFLNIALGFLMASGICIAQLVVLKNVFKNMNTGAVEEWPITALGTDMFNWILVLCVSVTVLAAIGMCLRNSSTTWQSLHTVWHWSKPSIGLTVIVWWFFG